MSFIKTLHNKYKIIATRRKGHEYYTTLEMWKEDDKVFTYMGKKDPKVDITKVFKTHDISWLNGSTEKDPIEVELFMDADVSGGSKGSFDEAPDAPEVYLNDAELHYKSIKIDISDILNIHLKGANETYEESLYDDALEYFSQQERDAQQFAEEQRGDYLREKKYY